MTSDQRKEALIHAYVHKDDVAFDDALQEVRKVEITATDLFMLCQRAAVALNRGNAAHASEILSHAQRIAARVGIKEQIIRAKDQEREDAVRSEVQKVLEETFEEAEKKPRQGGLIIPTRFQ